MEVGCGTGRLWSSTGLSVTQDCTLYLLDLSSGMVREANTALVERHGFRFLCADAQQLPFPDEHFDALISCHMLYHVPDRRRAITEFERVLLPGGCLYATTTGDNHLKEFGETIAAVSEYDVQMTASQNFGLGNGYEQLAERFPSVTMERYPDSLLVPEVQPRLDYAQSTGRLDDSHLERLREIYDGMIQDGPIRIQKDSGLFTATKAA